MRGDDGATVDTDDDLARAVHDDKYHVDIVNDASRAVVEHHDNNDDDDPWTSADEPRGGLAGSG